MLPIDLHVEAIHTRAREDQSIEIENMRNADTFLGGRSPHQLDLSVQGQYFCTAGVRHPNVDLMRTDLRRPCGEPQYESNPPVLSGKLCHADAIEDS